MQINRQPISPAPPLHRWLTTGPLPNLGRLLAAGRVAEVHAWGARVLKLYRAPAAKPVVFREAAIHAAVEGLRLPVPGLGGVVQVGERWGLVLDRVAGRSFADRLRDAPARAARQLERLARLQADIHQHAAPQPVGSVKLRLASAIARASPLDPGRRRALLRGLAAMPDGDRLCHGDFHPANVLGTAGRPVVIDWPDAGRGEPAADVARSWLLLRLHAEDLAEPYLAACGRVSGVPRAAMLGWLPFVAAARLAEGLPDETGRLLDLIGRP